MASSTYVLAVDIGTSRTAASTARITTTGNIETRRFALGRQRESAPSAVFVAPDELLFGEAAERRGLAQPERLVREFKRRIGDDVPVVVGSRGYAAEDLFAQTVSWVVDAVAEREGGQPEAIIATIPATWGDYRRSLVAAALAREISCPVELITEPVAAAWHYRATAPLGEDRVLAVYDLGGGTFDVALVTGGTDGAAQLIGTPAGISDFGGADFDDLVLRHAIAAAGLSDAALTGDPAVRVALAALRRECVEAKEALSFDSEAAIPVLVGGVGSTVRLTRSEFEGLVDAGIERTIDVLQSSLESADVGTRLDAILLTGGSSRIPRVAQLLSERFDAPIAVDADPKAIVSLGAARVLAAHIARAGASATAATAVVLAGAEALPGDPAFPGQASGDATAADADSPGAAASARRRWFRRLPAVSAIAAGSIVVASGLVLLGTTPLGNGSRLAASTFPVSMAESIGLPAGVPAAAAEQAPEVPAPAPPVAPGSEPRSSTRSTANPRQKAAERIAEARGDTKAQADASSSATAPNGSKPRTESPANGGSSSPSTPTPDPQPNATPDPPVPDPTPDPPAPDPTPDPPAPDPTPDPPAPDPTPSPTETSPPEAQ